MITKGKKEYIPYLKNIWKECFKDSDEYINFFFDNRYSDENVAVKICDGVPVAMLFVLPSMVVVKGKYEKYGYVYAVSTLEKYRGKGISTELMEFIEGNFDVKGTFLVPASESLFKFYEKRGYKDAFSLKEILFNTFETDINIKCEYDVSPKEYKELRDNMFFDEGYVSWSEEALKYALNENKFVGGKNYRVEYNNKVYAVMGYIEKGRFFAREAVVSDEDFYTVLNYIAVKENCNKVYTRIDIKRNIEGNKIKFGVLKGNDVINDGYFNIALD